MGSRQFETVILHSGPAVLLLGKVHGQRSMAGYSPRVSESAMTVTKQQQQHLTMSVLRVSPETGSE